MLKETHHPQKSFWVSSRYIISHQLKTLMCINNLHNSHCTKQEKHNFTNFRSCLTQLLNSYISRGSLHSTKRPIRYNQEFLNGQFQQKSKQEFLPIFELWNFKGRLTRKSMSSYSSESNNPLTREFACSFYSKMTILFSALRHDSNFFPFLLFAIPGSLINLITLGKK